MDGQNGWSNRSVSLHYGILSQHSEPAFRVSIPSQHSESTGENSRSKRSVRCARHDGPFIPSQNRLGTAFRVGPPGAHPVEPARPVDLVCWSNQIWPAAGQSRFDLLVKTCPESRPGPPRPRPPPSRRAVDSTTNLTAHLTSGNPLVTTNSTRSNPRPPSIRRPEANDGRAGRSAGRLRAGWACAGMEMGRGRRAVSGPGAGPGRPVFAGPGRPGPSPPEPLVKSPPAGPP